MKGLRRIRLWWWEWLQYLETVRERDPAARKIHAFWILVSYPGIHALVIYRVAHWIYGHGMPGFARFVSHIGRFLTGIEIHPGAQIGRHFFIDHGMAVVIGETAVIGDYVTLYHGVTLGGVKWDEGPRHPTLGRGVVGGACAMILGAINVGAGAKIGSNAVVVKPVPAGATVVGAVGRVLDQRRKNGEFSAYGLGTEEDDPLVKQIQALTQRIEELESKSRLFDVLKKELVPTSISTE